MASALRSAPVGALFKIDRFSGARSVRTVPRAQIVWPNISVMAKEPLFGITFDGGLLQMGADLHW